MFVFCLLWFCVCFLFRLLSAVVACFVGFGLDFDFAIRFTCLNVVSFVMGVIVECLLTLFDFWVDFMWVGDFGYFDLLF